MVRLSTKGDGALTYLLAVARMPAGAVGHRCRRRRPPPRSLGQYCWRTFLKYSTGKSQEAIPMRQQAQTATLTRNRSCWQPHGRPRLVTGQLGHAAAAAAAAATGYRSAPFWVPIGPCWVPIGPFWVQIGPCWVPIDPLLNTDRPLLGTDRPFLGTDRPLPVYRSATAGYRWAPSWVPIGHCWMPMGRSLVFKGC